MLARALLPSPLIMKNYYLDAHIAMRTRLKDEEATRTQRLGARTTISALG